jgi:glycosyltransferase involved in cell wall biosynthesis
MKEMTPQSLTVAICIPTYNREAVLIDTLRYALDQCRPADEILVIDQSEDHELETNAALQRLSAEGTICWIKHAPPNLPGARNRAVRETKCEILIFIDDDVIFERDFVDRHLRNYHGSDVAAVAGRVIQANKGYEMKGRARPWPRLLDYRFLRLDGDMRIEGIANFPGGNHSVRRSALLEIGGYDENYIGSALREESDAAIRLWKCGKAIVYDPTASLVHLAAPGGGCRIAADRRRSRPEWTLSFATAYFGFRHLFPRPVFWEEALIRNLRRYPLRRENVVKPWRLPRALYAYVVAVMRAAIASIAQQPATRRFVE